MRLKKLKPNKVRVGKAYRFRGPPFDMGETFVALKPIKCDMFPKPKRCSDCDGTMWECLCTTKGFYTTTACLGARRMFKLARAKRNEQDKTLQN